MKHLFPICAGLLALNLQVGSVMAADPAATPPQGQPAVSPTPAANAPATVAKANPTEGPKQDEIPVDDIRTLVEVLHKVKQDYVQEVNDKELLQNAIKGMLSGLDPHSAYLDQDAYEELQEGTTGEFGGLGIEIGSEDGFVKVISPIDDTPASRAGIQAGDIIIKLDEAPVKGMSLNDAIKKMRGKAGTDIRLTIVREGEEKPLNFTLTRAVIKIKSVRSRMLEPGFGYIRVSAFQAHTGDDLIDHITKLEVDSKDGLRGLVLDLRNNPGGVLGAAVSVSDAFMTSGKIVYTEGRVKDAQLDFEAKPPDLIDGAPLVVLVNEGSASASEIVAGALQDSKRAVIMGRQTFGKGSVQTIMPMNNSAAIKITTARYFTPSGRSIQAEGIKPDIVIDKFKLTALKSSNDEFVKESHLERHLDNPNNKNTSAEDKQQATEALAAKAGGGETKPPAKPEDLAATDFELYEALNLLKGMALLHTGTAAVKGQTLQYK